jgi:HEPN/RES N-terminal domain 1
MEDAEDIRVCHGCIGDPFLSAEVRSEGKRGKCTYCGRIRRSLSVQELADGIHSVIQSDFNLTATEPQGYELALAQEFGWERAGEPVNHIIQEIAGVDEPIATTIQEHLSDRFGYHAAKEGEEDPYGDEACYEGKGPDEWGLRETWDWCRSEVRFRSRFFSPHARSALDDIFGDIGVLRTWEGVPAI